MNHYARSFLFACLPFLIFPVLARADWNQIYLSAGVGADALTDDGRIGSPNGQGHVSYGGPVGGDVGWEVGAGIDAQLGQMFVVGAFANLDWSNMDTTGTFHSNSTTVHASAFDLKNAWTVGGRAGVLVTPSTLAYGLLGYSWFDFDNPRVSAVDSSSDGGGGFSATLNEPIRNGITVGGGIEQKISPDLSLKAEYRFTDLGDVDQAIETVKVDRHSSIQMVRVGAAYRLGWGETPTATSEPSTCDEELDRFLRRCGNSYRRLRAGCLIARARSGRSRKSARPRSRWGRHFRHGDGGLRLADCASMADRSLRRL